MTLSETQAIKDLLIVLLERLEQETMAVTMKLHTPKSQEEIFQPSFVMLGKLSTTRSETPSKLKKPALPPLTQQEHKSLLDELALSHFGTKQD